MWKGCNDYLDAVFSRATARMNVAFAYTAEGFIFRVTRGQAWEQEWVKRQCLG